MANHSLTNIPDPVWAALLHKAGGARRLRDGIRILLERWAAGKLDPLDLDPPHPGRVAGGRKGGLLGASKLTAKRRSERAKHAIRTRWAKHRAAALSVQPDGAVEMRPAATYGPYEPDQPVLWCGTCQSWRHTVPCGRDECPTDFKERTD